MDISYSKISTWKSCRKMYYWTYDKHLEPKVIPFYLTLGKAIHEALANYYIQEPTNRSSDTLILLFEQSLERQWKELTTNREPDLSDEDNFRKNKKNGLTMLEKYWNKYGIDEQIPKVKTEVKIEVPLDNIYSPKTEAGEPLFFIAKLDAIMLHWILEHKTGNPDLEGLALEDEQSMYYCWGLRALGHKVEGTLYNIIPSPSARDAELTRLEVERTDIELANVPGEILNIADEISWLPRILNRGWNCRNCQFRQLCRGERMGADIDYLIEKNFKQGGER